MTNEPSSRKVGICFALISMLSVFACTPPNAKPNLAKAYGTASKSTLKDASDGFFESSSIPKLVLKISEEQLAKLNQEARQYVKCTLVENGHSEWIDVGLKLKGAAGSFRDLAEKPAFTLNVTKFRKGQTFHDLEKFHLNNSVQDELYTNEWLCSSICRDAGIPAPRVTHARVWLNDRNLGLYVFKESFDRKFLQRHFVAANGNLYDGGFCQDIDVDLEKDAGDGPTNFSDLHSLRQATEENEPSQRMERLSQLLDLEAFRTFMAFEMMACHWDGYVSKANNYRLYFSPDSKRAYFFPHGMDQMFQDPDFQTFGHTPALVANAYRSVPEWNIQFRKRVEELLPLFEGDRLAKRVASLQKKLGPEIKQFHPGGEQGAKEQTAELVVRLRERFQRIAQQLTEPDPPIPEPPIEDAQNILEIGINETVPLLNWEPKQETELSILERIDSPDSTPLFSILVGEGNDCIASWRLSIPLPQGRYRFTADIRVQDVVERADDERGLGAGLRISGANRENSYVATLGWTTASYDFQTVEEPQVVQLVAELRATKGMMQIKNLSITRLDP